MDKAEQLFLSLKWQRMLQLNIGQRQRTSFLRHTGDSDTAHFSNTEKQEADIYATERTGKIYDALRSLRKTCSTPRMPLWATEICCIGSNSL